MKIHNLKTIPPFFDDVRSGKKPFELRKNDRDFKVGELIHLEEYIPETKKYTGRDFSGFITYILKDFPGLQDGYCILGIIEFPRGLISRKPKL